MLDVTRLGRKSFMSQAALSEVLTAVRNAEELPAGVSRHALKRARQAKASVETPYGHAAASNQRLQRRVSARQIGGRPSFSCKPWGLVFYSDEVTPGNALKANNRRKMQAIYWSFAQFGPDALSHERSWFLLTCVRSKTVDKCAGMLCRPSCGPGLAFGLESSFAWVHTARGSWSPTSR